MHPPLTQAEASSAVIVTDFQNLYVLFMLSPAPFPNAEASLPSSPPESEEEPVAVQGVPHPVRRGVSLTGSCALC